VWGRWITWRRRTVQSVPLLQEVISYAVKQYCYKIRKNAYLKIVTCIIDVLLALHQVLHHLLVMSQCFLILVIPVLAEPTGRGSGGRTPLSGITATVHHPVTQSKHVIKVSIIN
jgi:hypothetical protein